jgi:hypothetical protein
LAAFCSFVIFGRATLRFGAISTFSAARG